MNTLPKSERLHGKTTVSALMSKGRWGSVPGLKYCVLIPENVPGEPVANKIMVSVPKRLFKRAVKRNLLKRRLREGYRTQKDLLSPAGIQILFLYNTKDVLESEEVKENVGKVLKAISDERQQ